MSHFAFIRLEVAGRAVCEILDEVQSMSSQKQIAANRANATRSTGPTTDGGKSRSRMNAWKHGLTAEKVVIDGEDAQELAARTLG
jgi:hypothetical protein